MSWQRVFVGFSLAINGILIYSLIWGGQGLQAYRNLKEQHQVLEERIKDLDAKNVALSREIRLLQSDEKYQEKIIRNRFNFVKDNEILYIFPESQDTAKTGAGSHETKD
ncbi:Septum formation initiator family protein [uncultured delta proteobacterium]|uniref:Septum formation initiator family protein n=1 Tax=uncultured delta proteobacterium TaxID=34034 RepID=A0A212J3Z6_9DELT|nr:Septum formation initiator family protein [uncultured delta proteobacterium]